MYGVFVLIFHVMAAIYYGGHVCEYVFKHHIAAQTVEVESEGK